MDNKRFGFFTPSGSFAALLTVLIVVGVGWLRGGILFNPGALNAKTGAALGGVSSHAELTSRCSSCHTAFWSQARMSDRCVDCHSDIAAQLQDPGSIHGVFQAANPGLTCRMCHSEHKGADAPMTDTVNMEFPHAALGYALTAHLSNSDGTAFTCEDCHGKTYTAKYDQAICTTCHQQIKPGFMPAHLQAYGDNCLGCHDGVESYGHAFNHAAVVFRLTGKHAGLGCGQCHRGARSIADLQATAQDCYSCHARNDAHQGQLGTDCAACHTTTGWLPSTFNHNLSAFTLTGKHASVPCASCHVNALFKGTPTECYSCHARDDKHNGQFGTACDACHTSAGWLPATFDHSKFPLAGGHANLACTRCHNKGVYTGLSSICAACHADPPFHAGLFPGTPCSACHNTNAWTPASFNATHPAGCGERSCINHEGASCRDCHAVNLMTATCTKCHDSNTPGDGGGD